MAREENPGPVGGGPGDHAISSLPQGRQANLTPPRQAFTDLSQPEANWLGQPLLCPRCGNDYLHHDRVDVFERNEDEAEGLHVTVEGVDQFGVRENKGDARATIDGDLKSNPSARRHGLTIRFWCELCPARPLLTIAQHKGTTYTRLTDPPDVVAGPRRRRP